MRTLQAAQGTGIPSMSWPGGCLGGASVPSRDGGCLPGQRRCPYSCLGPAAPPVAVYRGRALSAVTGHVSMLLLRAQELMVQAWAVAEAGRPAVAWHGPCRALCRGKCIHVNRASWASRAS